MMSLIFLTLVQAQALIELIQHNEESKREALKAIAKTAKDEQFNGHGWSLL